MPSNLQSCTCSYSYTVTDTYEGLYYLVPSAPPPTSGPGCDTCHPTTISNPNGPTWKFSPGPDGKLGTEDDIITETNKLDCNNPIFESLNEGEITQDPPAGSKQQIGSPQKTGSKKDPEKSPCNGDCDCNTGTAQIVSQTETEDGTTDISVELEVKNPSMNCHCPGLNIGFKEPCPDFKIKVQVKAKVMKTKQEQQYTVTCGCES